jgi:hypothetical protein
VKPIRLSDRDAADLRAAVELLWRPGHENPPTDPRVLRTWLSCARDWLSGVLAAVDAVIEEAARDRP